MKHTMISELRALSLCDLKKVALWTNTPPSGPVTLDSLVETLSRESPSLVRPAIERIISEGHVGTPLPEAESFCSPASSESSDSGASSAAVAELKEMVAKTQEGVTRFAENVDARVSEVEAIAQRLMAREPLTIRVIKPVEAPTPGESVSEKVAYEGPAHKDFPNLLAMARAKVNILMVGPAGSGKTTAAEQLANALGLEFYFNGAIDTEYKLKGFVDAQGRVVSTEFRKAFERGGVYLFDEVDASLPAATMAFNAALANGWCDFPDKRVTRHPDTIIIAAANTFLGGATFEYVGRNKQDAAFVDRFMVLPWDIDENLEARLCSDQAWLAHVQRLRSNARRQGLKVIISPRASIEGAKLLAAGLPWAFAEQAAIKKGMSADQWSAISK